MKFIGCCQVIGVQESMVPVVGLFVDQLRQFEQEFFTGKIIQPIGDLQVICTPL